MVNYIKLAITNISIARLNSISDTVNISLSGQYFNGNFGTQNNTLSLKWRYREAGGTWSSYTTVTATKTGNKFSYSGTLGTTFDYQEEYEFEVVAQDKLVTDTKNITVTAGIPLIDMWKNNVKINENLDANKYLNIFPIGSIYISVNSTNPSNYFGGTWVEWGTGKVPVGIDTSDTDFDTVEKTGGSKYLQAHKHKSRAVKETQSQISGGEHASNFPLASRTDGQNMGWSDYSSNSAVGDVETNVTTGNSGNLQPYITCFMWKRVS